MILSARGLRYTYPGDVLALDGLDLDVWRGKRLAVLGPNGAGKTTLLLHLNGTLKPQGGHITLDGEPTAYDRKNLNAWRRRVGLVMQDPDDQLFAGTVLDDVAYGPLNLGLTAGEARDRAQEALAALRIEDLAHRPPHLLSGGQRRRVAIAGALAMQPGLILLDEPTAGLDAHGEAHLLGVLNNLVEAGTSVVMTTHDVDLAAAWADRVAVFNQGRVLAEGEPGDILADREILKQARLKRPWAIEVGLAAREAGLLAAEATLPRDRRQVLDLLAAIGGKAAPSDDHPTVTE